jgi:peptide chain release factor 1
MIDKLKAITFRFEELAARISDPATLADMKKYTQLSKAYKELSPIVAMYRDYTKNEKELDETKLILVDEKDTELLAMLKEEIEQLQKKQKELLEALKLALLPKDPNDDKNSILELRAGTGGDEAAIWVGDLFRMYQRFAERQGWKLQVIDYTEGTAGGYKEITSTVSGNCVYSILKYESGIHRVQRVPATETQGRIHTSAATVAVLPEIDDVGVELDMNEIRKDTFCSSGPGGQSVNTTYSAIRLTHLPTGIVVSCQDEKSQLKNLDKALKVLRARLYERARKEREEKVGAQRRMMVGSGDRSEKIRTYNYPQSRITDHRIGYTAYNLATVLNGELEKVVEQLRIADQVAKLKESGEEEG